jgi:hypothetical protein
VVDEVLGQIQHGARTSVRDREDLGRRHLQVGHIAEQRAEQALSLAGIQRAQGRLLAASRQHLHGQAARLVLGRRDQQQARAVGHIQERRQHGRRRRIDAVHIVDRQHQRTLHARDREHELRRALHLLRVQPRIVELAHDRPTRRCQRPRAGLEQQLGAGRDRQVGRRGRQVLEQRAHQ